LPEAPPTLELRSVSKSFGTLRALDGVSARVAPGEVIGLLGENGAGKSTLMNLLYGLVRPDAGAIRFAGREVTLRSPRDARARGVGMVHQHFSLVPDLTVVENFVLDERAGWLDRKQASRRVAELARELDFEVDPAARVVDLSVGDQQRVEILKAVKDGAVRVLILDEPTASLTPDEVDDLFTLIRRLTAAGRSVLFISHKLREVLAVTDRVIVLRAGRVVAERSTPATTAAELGSLMVGVAPAASPAPTETAVPGGEVLVVRGLRVPAPRGRGEAVAGVDLDVCAGEIVGVAGVDGNGQAEMVQAIAGLRRASSGSIALAGRTVARPTARRMAELGLAYVPADRRALGLVLGLTIAENLVLKHLRRPELVRNGLLRRAAVRHLAEASVERYGVRPPDCELDVSALSGGNQQRVVLARELAFAPRLIVAENPTRGLDVRATESVRAEIRKACAAGAGALLVSTDLDEILVLADRVYVMYEGRLAPCPPERAAIGRLLGGVP